MTYSAGVEPTSLTTAVADCSGQASADMACQQLSSRQTSSRVQDNHCPPDVVAPGRHKRLVKSPALLTWPASSRLQRRLVTFIILEHERTWLLRCSGWQQLVSLITDDSLMSAVAANATGSILWHAIWSQRWGITSAGRWIVGHGSNAA